MILGYARVSTSDQHLDAQFNALKSAGAERIYEEKFTGKSRTRPELERMLDQVREGDVIVETALSEETRLVHSEAAEDGWLGLSAGITSSQDTFLFKYGGQFRGQWRPALIALTVP